jgi:hypothetical protein
MCDFGIFGKEEFLRSIIFESFTECLNIILIKGAINKSNKMPQIVLNLFEMY